MNHVYSTLLNKLKQPEFKRNKFRFTMMSPPRPEFVAFDERNAVRIYQRNLPHWRQKNATYFITFRLGDSIPQGVLAEWEHEKRLWLEARGIHVKAGDTIPWKNIELLPKPEQKLFHKHFNRLFHYRLDECHGECLLKHATCRKIIRGELFTGDGMLYHLGDYVLMPNHVHLLLTLVSESEVEWVLKKIKGFTARLCNQALGRSGRFWQPDSYDHIVRTLEQLVQYRRYIADNPSKAGLRLENDALYHADWMDEWFAP